MKRKNDEGAVLKAIIFLVKHGHRGSEWQEAGLLNAIEKVLDGHDTSSSSLMKLIEEAKHN